MHQNGVENLNQYLLSLARGPDNRVTYLSGYYINGFRFHTKAREQTKRCQNSGVMVRGENNGGISFYGTLSNVIELRYTDGVRVVLFQCEWYDTTREGVGYKKDHHGIISVNTKRKLKTEEPFVLASQAIQVYYVSSLKNPNWTTVVETTPRNLYQMPSEDEAYQEDATTINITGIGNDEEDEITWRRVGLENINNQDETEH
ncbi:hypothetical protein LINGRAHAP2_LOCUS7801 [Linum grandiflorum]